MTMNATEEAVMLARGSTCVLIQSIGHRDQERGSGWGGVRRESPYMAAVNGEGWRQLVKGGGEETSRALSYIFPNVCHNQFFSIFSTIVFLADYHGIAKV